MTNTSSICNKKRDKRIWSKYNSSLVKRFDLLIDTSFLKKWEESLKLGNEGKVGHPYEYPQEFFVFLSKIRSLWNVPFRELEGFVRKLSELTGKFRPLSYVAIFQRIRNIPIEEMINEINGSARDGMTVIIDSSGLKITERGDWLSSKWNKKRKGWIKIHVAIDCDTMNVVSLTVTDEHKSDTKEFLKVLNPVIDKTSRVYGDKGYDSRNNFEYLYNKGVNAIILPRSNATSQFRGSPQRAKVVRAIKRMGLESWKEEMQYGKRWRIEIFFSALKRTIGEVIMARNIIYQIQEAVMKIYTYFLLRKDTVVR